MAIDGALNVAFSTVLFRRVRQHVAKVDSLRSRYAHRSDGDIRAACQRLVETPKIGSGRAGAPDFYRLIGYEFGDADADAVALASEAFSRFPPAPLPRGARLYPEQVLAAVHLTIGSLVQMDTGEGKTFAIMAAALALLRRHSQVVIVTANPYLAARDATACGAFWGGLGVSVGLVLPAQYPTPNWPTWDASVVYTTAESFVFAQLQADLDTVAAHRQTGDVAVLLDEADAILLEKLGGDFSLTRHVASDTKDWSVALAVATQLKPEHVERVPGEVAVALTLAGEDEIDRLVSPGSRDEDRLMVLRDVELAYAALNVAIEGHDYRIIDGQLIPLDPSSGWPIPFTVPSWVAPLVQYRRLGRQLQSIKMHVANGMDTLRRMPHLAGASGTLVSEALEYLLLLNTPTAMIPPRTPRRQQDIPDRFFAGAEYAVRHVVSVAAREAQRRPVLVLAGTTSAAATIADELRRTAGGAVEVRYAAAETIAGERMFEDAGRPGVVVVSTRVAGRGVDIRLADEAKSEGVLLIMVGHASEARLDRQMLGRVGRGGDPYSAYFVNALDDELLRQIKIVGRAMWDLSGDEGFSSQLLARSVRSFQQSRRRVKLQVFAFDVSRGRADARGHAFISSWYRKLQDSGTPEQCGDEFLEALTAALAEHLVPRLGDGVVTVEQARTVAELVGAMCDDPGQAPAVEAALTGQSRDDAVQVVTRTLLLRLREPIARNRALHARQAGHDGAPARAMIGPQFRRMVVEVVQLLADDAMDDTAPGGWNAEVLDRLRGLYPCTVVVDDIDHPESGWDEPSREVVRAAFVADALRAYEQLSDRATLLYGPDAMDAALGQILDFHLGYEFWSGWEPAEPAVLDPYLRTFAEHILETVFSVRLQEPERPLELTASSEPQAPDGAADPVPTPPESEAPREEAQQESAVALAVRQDEETAPALVPDTAAYLGTMLTMLRPPRTSRLIAFESIAAVLEPYLADAHRRAHRVWRRSLSLTRNQYAYEEARRDVAIEHERRLVEQVYRNLLRSGEPHRLDELFRTHENNVRPPTMRLDANWRIEAPPPGTTTASRHVVPTDRAGVILYFVAALEAQAGRKALPREQVLPALNLLLDACPLETLGEPERVREAMARWMRSDLRRRLPPWRRRPLDTCVQDFLDFLFRNGLAAQRPRGVRAVAAAALRRLKGRIGSTRVLMGGIAALVLAGLGSLLVLFHVKAPTTFPPLPRMLDYAFGGGLLESGSAFGMVVAPTILAAFITWLVHGPDSVRGGPPYERVSFQVFVLGLCVWFVVTEPSGSVVSRIAVALVIAAAALVFRNAAWLAENSVQLRVLAGLLAIFVAVTATVHLAGQPWSVVPLGVFCGVCVLNWATVSLRRQYVDVDSLVVTDGGGGELLASRRRITARLGWQPFLCAFAAAWLVGELAGRTWAPAAEVAAYVLVLGVFIRGIARSATDVTLWRKRMRIAGQEYRPTRGARTLAGRLRTLRRRLETYEAAFAVGCVAIAVALVQGTDGRDLFLVNTTLVALAVVSFAVAFTDFAGMFAESVLGVVGASGSSVAQAGDEQEKELTESVQYVLRKIARRLSIIIVGFLALKQVADLLSVWSIVVAIWHWLIGLF